VPVETVQFLLQLLLKQKIFATYHHFARLVVNNFVLTGKLHSLYVKELEILERSESELDI